MQSKFYYKNDLLQDTAIIWYENGNMRCKRVYDEGKQHGLYQYWYENGQLKTRGTFIKGAKAGKWQHFNKDGILIKG